MRELEGFGDWLEHAHDALDRPRERSPVLSRFFLEQLVEGHPVEPLEHHVGNPRAVRRGQRADVARLDDAGRPARELGEKRALLDEVLQQLLAHLRRGIHQRLEALQRDRLLPQLVHRLVDDGKATFADDAFDHVLVVDGGSNQPERVFYRHVLLTLRYAGASVSDLCRGVPRLPPRRQHSPFFRIG